MKRNIIVIDEDKCNGCGACVPDCPEGALQIINGKARLVGELLCDGLGACIGTCPEGAMRVEEQDVEAYDERKVMENVVKGGETVIRAHLKHLKDHSQCEYRKVAIDYLKENAIPIPEEKEEKPLPCGCPGTLAQDFRKKDEGEADQGDVCSSGTKDVQSQLEQWPIQLTLLNPHAPYFKNADLLIAADCVAFSFGDFHNQFLRGRRLAIFCPKLDATREEYIEKLATIIRDNDIRSIAALRMEVPCCGGLVRILEEAISRSGKKIDFKEEVVSLRGEIKHSV